MTKLSASRHSLKAEFQRKSHRRRSEIKTAAEAERAPARTRNDLLPRLELVERSLEQLRPPERNVRPARAAHVREIVRSIETLGFCAPVLIDAEGRVIDGWASVEAAKQVGLHRVPCVVAGHLTPAERRLLRITLNRLGETGSWDVNELKLEFEELVIADIPIEVSGFSTAELDLIMFEDERVPAKAGPLEPDVSLDPIAKSGDVFALGRHLIACGDARDRRLLAGLMSGEQARLILTDPPYNVPIQGHVTGSNHREFAMASGEMNADQFLAFNCAWLDAASSCMREGGVVGAFIDWRGYPCLHQAAAATGLDALNLVVWSKSNAGMGSLYRSAHELLPLFKKGKEPHLNNVELGRHGRWRSNVWIYPGASSPGSDARKGLRLHPTVKPVAMLADALLDLTGTGETVLDPFLGSGSTLMAAERTNRVCRGVEIDPLYVDVILRRFEAETGRAPKRILSCDKLDEIRTGEPASTSDTSG